VGAHWGRRLETKLSHRAWRMPWTGPHDLVFDGRMPGADGRLALVAQRTAARADAESRVVCQSLVVVSVWRRVHRASVMSDRELQDTWFCRGATACRRRRGTGGEPPTTGMREAYFLISVPCFVPPTRTTAPCTVPARQHEGLRRIQEAHCLDHHSHPSACMYAVRPVTGCTDTAFTCRAFPRIGCGPGSSGPGRKGERRSRWSLSGTQSPALRPDRGRWRLGEPGTT